MSSYNLRVYTYTNGQQFRFYKKSITEEKEIKQEKEEKENNIQKDIYDIKKEGSVDTTHSDIVSHNRTKQKLYELARANIWEWFITLTFNQKEIDSSNYELLTKTVSKWLNHIRERNCPNLKYLLVPELHKDGVHYHFHGLMSNADGLDFIESGIVQNGKMVYNMERWKYGFSTATRIEDYNRVCSYISKYITKDLLAATKGKKRYWASRNLEKPIIESYGLVNEELEEYMTQIMESASFVKTQKCDIIGQTVTYVEVPF